MKKIIIFVFSAFLLSACSSSPSEQHISKVNDSSKQGNFDNITYFYYQGHRYIKFTKSYYTYFDYYVSSNSVVHDPDCPCHNK